MNWMMRILLLMLFSFLFAGWLRAADEPMNDEQIKQLLHDRIEIAKQGVGIVVGIVDEKGPRIIAYGKTDKDGKEVGGDTLFEIGSVTKVFTSLVLADMVEHNELKLDDPISKFLPASVKVPSRNGREITLVDLATHTSGLPRLPGNLEPRDANNPYADYTVQQMYDFLSSYKLPRDIGSKYEYSNFGDGLLGHLLELKSGTNYEALIKARICEPLEMRDTCITLSPEQRARFARGHGLKGEPAENFDLPALAGAGALRSTANDMLKFLAANIGLTKSSLEPAMELARTPRHKAGSPDVRIGLGWHIISKYDEKLVWHNGATGGYHAFAGFDRKLQRGVVVLANSVNSIDDIGFHLLEAKYPLANIEPPSNHVAIQLDEKLLDHYAGHYQLAPDAIFTVRRHGNHLEAQLTGQPFLEIFPETHNRFFYKDVDAQITFHEAEGDEPAFLVLHQNGIEQAAKKLPGEAPRDHVAIRLDPAKYDAYVGQYELQPGAILTLKREGDRLMAQLTGQPFFEIFPESETNFFYKVVDAQLSFEKNGKGEITGLVLHQNGRDMAAKRVAK
ncbi:MAG TPA: serine hydrolase [Verrucomicrobiae bacterium]|nr:serine hydrolase [Verrucomicrobiae bacterium]